MDIDLEALRPASFREEVRRAIHATTVDACTRVIGTDPLTAPYAYFLRARVRAADPDSIDAARDDVRAGLTLLERQASDDVGTEEMAALRPRHLDSVRALDIVDVLGHVLGAAVRSVHEHAPARVRSSYARMLGSLLDSLGQAGSVLTPPDQIAAWLATHPGSTVALPLLEVFYAAVAEHGYPNPMPEVMRHLTGAHPLRAPRHPGHRSRDADPDMTGLWSLQTEVLARINAAVTELCTSVIDSGTTAATPSALLLRARMAVERQDPEVAGRDVAAAIARRDPDAMRQLTARPIPVGRPHGGGTIMPLASVSVVDLMFAFVRDVTSRDAERRPASHTMRAARSPLGSPPTVSHRPVDTDMHHL